MVKNFYIQDDAMDGFKQFLLVSLILHSSFLIFFALKNLVFNDVALVIPESIRVDIVDLPDKIPDHAAPNTTEKSPTKSLEEKQKMPAPKAQPSPTTKEDQRSALNRLKTNETLADLKKQALEEKLNKVQTPATVQYKGNIISSGNSFTGLSRLRVNEYLEDLVARVREEWVIPQWLNNANLKAALLVSVDSRGYVIRKEIRTSSGNSIFDSSCLAAVEAAAPFAPPPDEVKEALIMIRFPFE